MLLALVATLSLGATQDVEDEFLAPAVIEGRFLDPAGAPVAGVRLTLDARFMPRSHSAQGWTALAAASDASGHFSLRVMPANPLAFTLTAEHADYATTEWSWRELQSGQRADLGDLPLHPVGRVVGSVLSEEGVLSSGTWFVDLRILDRLRVGGRGFVQRDYATLVDSKTGEFRFEGVPIGKASVDARLGRTETRPAHVLVREGLEEVLDLTFAGPDPARSIEVQWRSGSTSALARAVSLPAVLDAGPRVVLVTPEGERRVVRGKGYFGGTAKFSDLRATTYRVEVEAPEFLPWTRDGVRPGERVTADLVGSASIVLDVVDQETAAPIDRYGAGVVPERTGVPVHVFVDENSPPPANGIIGGLLPSSFELRISALGYLPVRVRVDDLGAGERRVLRVELDRSRSFDVRVLDVDGAPVANSHVTFLSEAGSGGRVFERRRRTDAAGRLHFDGLGAGPYTVVAEHAPWLVSRSTLRADDSGAVHDLAAPAHGWIDARLVLPPDLDAKSFEFLPVDEESAGAARWAPGTRVAPDGTLRIGPLMPGVRELLARYATPSGVHVQLELGAIAVEGGRVSAESWDLREHCPGWVQFEAPQEAPLEVVFRWTGGRRDRRALRAGRHLVAGLDPGSWGVLVRPVLGQWVWVRPDPVTVEPGRGAVLDLGMELVERDVRILDDEGNPLRFVVILTGPAGDPLEALQRPRPDAEGRLRLSLPAGEVRFARRVGAPSLTVDWRADPEELVVRLP